MKSLRARSPHFRTPMQCLFSPLRRQARALAFLTLAFIETSLPGWPLFARGRGQQSSGRLEPGRDALASVKVIARRSGLAEAATSPRQAAAAPAPPPAAAPAASPATTAAAAAAAHAAASAASHAAASDTAASDAAAAPALPQPPQPCPQPQPPQPARRASWMPDPEFPGFSLSKRWNVARLTSEISSSSRAGDLKRRRTPPEHIGYRSDSRPSE